MGSGSKFHLGVAKAFGLSVEFDRFPHEYSFNLLIGCFTIYIGIGKGYDEV
jgi:hypothetical protein